MEWGITTSITKHTSRRTRWWSVVVRRKSNQKQTDKIKKTKGDIGFDTKLQFTLNLYIMGSSFRGHHIYSYSKIMVKVRARNEARDQIRSLSSLFYNIFHIK